VAHNKSLHRTHLSGTPFAEQKPCQPAFAAELNRYVPMRISLLVLFSLALLGCSEENSKVEERKSHWKNLVEETIQIGDSKMELLSWAETNGLKISHDQISNKYVSLIETIPVNSLVCSKWHIVLNVALDSQNNVKEREIDAAGVCL